MLIYRQHREVKAMVTFDMLIAQIKQLESKMDKADTIEEFKRLHADLKELLELYDAEKKSR